MTPTSLMSCRFFGPFIRDSQITVPSGRPSFYYSLIVLPSMMMNILAMATVGADKF